MTLLEIIREIDSIDEDQIIFASRVGGKWVPQSRAVLVDIPDDGVDLRRPEGFDYLLEVFLAREAIEAWKELSGHSHSVVEQELDAVVYYAEHDAYGPVVD